MEVSLTCGPRRAPKVASRVQPAIRAWSWQGVGAAPGLAMEVMREVQATEQATASPVPAVPQESGEQVQVVGWEVAAVARAHLFLSLFVASERVPQDNLEAVAAEVPQSARVILAAVRPLELVAGMASLAEAEGTVSLVQAAADRASVRPEPM